MPKKCLYVRVLSVHVLMQVGRRYKITNPDKFRTFYGKMQFMLQDAQVQERSGLNLVKDIKARCRLDILVQQYLQSMVCSC